MQPRPDMNSVPSRQDLEGLHYGRVPDPLDLEGVDRFTFPVRDLEKAERFYTQVLGGEVVQREFTEIGLHEQLAIRVRLASHVDVCLVEQRYGWNPPDTANPHWGFAIPGADVDTWIDHLADWAVPSAQVVRGSDPQEPGETTRVEVHFFDPDGNHLELVAWDYLINDKVWPGRYNYWDLVYRHDTWPPAGQAEREA